MATDSQVLSQEQIADDALRFKLETFEGPLDLLLKLIAKNKVDIMDIPIVLIFDQYMEYIDRMKRMDMDIAGEFITMAAELMLIKSKMLLPKQKNEEEEDPRAVLAAALTAYKCAKEAAGELNTRYAVYGGRMVKESEDIAPDTSYVAPQDTDALIHAFEKLLRRKKLQEESKNAAPAKTLQEIVTKKITPIQHRVYSVLRHLKKNGSTPFEALMLASSTTRSDLIASFAALLQLIRRHLVIITVDDPENPILEINYDRTKFSPDSAFNTTAEGST
ncbi:MAG: segregation/condensation protein A [Ruminococcaceae bacterium]|nr:segregation/condensation protein A [Oscillospiraceae bacterium]